MPTGYTHAIGEGIDFRGYVLSCARAFGALISMRDAPNGAPIPEEFEPSDFSAKELARATEKATQIKAMTDQECHAAALEEYKQQVEYHKAGIAKCAALKAKYEAMLAEVDAWMPPSEDHEGLKKFMRDQIVESIHFNCGSGYHQEQFKQLRRLSGKEWREKELNEALNDISFHSKSQLEENERTAARNKWLRQLRESI